MSNAARPRRFPRLRRLLALATDSWAARSYWAALGASVTVASVFPESGIAAGYLLLTAPLSAVSMVFPFGPGTEGGPVTESLALAFWGAWLLLSALVNAAVLGTLAHHVRDVRTARHA
ncbi:SCO4225 family membrane protein [Streptomyces monticola]|uniref:SCO4225 family membrane protein n=1 Tax=Streptomyces monticola TaxID=2666263 RepID=A0ABW2JFL4_9ACTN